MLVVFVALLIGPIVAKKFIGNLGSDLQVFDLMQPTGQNNNDTTDIVTGSNLLGFATGAALGGVNSAASGGGAASAETTAAVATTDAGDPFPTITGLRMLARW